MNDPHPTTSKPVSAPTPRQDAWFLPEWPAPARVRSLSTLRGGGVSDGEAHRYASLNLATHVGDDPDAVRRNRDHLRAALPADPLWLHQVHGTKVIDADRTMSQDGVPPEADAAVTRSAGRVLAVMTADCLPVLLADRAGTVVAVAHAGWRGLAAGVIENTVRTMNVKPDDIVAWLGPAIGPREYEVGSDVRDAFVFHDLVATDIAHADPAAIDAFELRANGKYLADLYHLARRRLERVGVTDVHGGDACTYTERKRFFSFRRDGKTGRMATLIWLE